LMNDLSSYKSTAFCIGDIMLSVLASSAVDRMFEPPT
jgi:hypothetical protein